MSFQAILLSPPPYIHSDAHLLPRLALNLVRSQQEPWVAS